MILGKKIAAIRGAEGLSRADFCQRAGISSDALINVENGDSFTDRTRRKIIRAVEHLGYRITEYGIERAVLPTEVLEGPDALTHLLDDIAETADELLINGADERKTPPEIVEYVRTLRDRGLAMRHMVKEGDTFLRGDVSEYRWVPERHYINAPRFVYGDTMAVQSGGSIVLIRSHDIAEAERLHFDLLWPLLEQPAESTCRDRYV